MTDKRFIVDDAGTLIDMQTRTMFDIVEEVCPLLNEQHETIQQLQESLNYNGAYITAKKKKGAWRNDLIDELRKSNQTKDDYIIEIDTDRKKLLKDNEQLKKENQQIKHLIDEAYETERTELGRSVLRQLRDRIQ